MTTPRCFRCGLFIRDVCSQCGDPMMDLASSIMGMGMLTTVLSNPDTPRVLTSLRAAFAEGVNNAAQA